MCVYIYICAYIPPPSDLYSTDDWLIVSALKL